MIKIYNDINKFAYPVKITNFPAGEVGVNVKNIHYSNEYHIQSKIQSSDDIMILLNTVDALRRRYSGVKINLTLHYVPYGRQDRVCNEGESFSLKVFCDLINSCGFNRVVITDPHSDVTPALINNVVVGNSWHIFNKVIDNWSNVTIVAPDAGAYKKCYTFAEKVGAKDVIVANKVRELSTGQIKGYSISTDDMHQHCVVLDDIIDGGRTFVELHKCLKDHALQIDLCVTHGIFSKGVDVVCDIYDNVYTTNSYKETVDERVNLHVLNV